MEANLKGIIFKILNDAKENVSLAEGYNDYLIWGDKESLEEIAEEIEKVVTKNLLNNG